MYNTSEPKRKQKISKTKKIDEEKEKKTWKKREQEN